MLTFASCITFPFFNHMLICPLLHLILILWFHLLILSPAPRLLYPLLTPSSLLFIPLQLLLRHLLSLSHYTSSFPPPQVIYRLEADTESDVEKFTMSTVDGEGVLRLVGDF